MIKDKKKIVGDRHVKFGMEGIILYQLCSITYQQLQTWRRCNTFSLYLTNFNVVESVVAEIMLATGH